MKVLKFDIDNYEYQRIICAISVSAPIANGTTIPDKIFDLREDYETLIGIAVYDRSADVHQFIMESQLVNGDFIQDYTARKGWIFNGNLTEDSNMPEAEHYKMLDIPYKQMGKKQILFRIKNESGAAFASNLKLDIVLMLRRRINK